MIGVQSQQVFVQPLGRNGSRDSSRSRVRFERAHRPLSRQLLRYQRLIDGLAYRTAGVLKHGPVPNIGSVAIGHSFLKSGFNDENQKDLITDIADLATRIDVTTDRSLHVGSDSGYAKVPQSNRFVGLHRLIVHLQLSGLANGRVGHTS
ncbi:hypothetical protein EVAR_31895_1 [Eumeta japonica]|uniref:Uncharacterized protein n=1 Tax=Eumeta variegata TaxID=151549 RepID=A0A4C1WZ90_EUMVA|nr:hypothetical protein EVAR_31895_1 [Eumeta japonica]